MGCRDKCHFRTECPQNPNIKEALSASIDKLTIDKKSTKPPKYFVESTLLSAMTKASRYVSDEELKKALDDKNSGSI